MEQRAFFHSLVFHCNAGFLSAARIVLCLRYFPQEESRIWQEPGSSQPQRVTSMHRLSPDLFSTI